MKQYWIVWNKDRTEGYITTRKADTLTAKRNKPNCENGYPSRSVLATGFFEAYGDEPKSVTVQEVEL